MMADLESVDMDDGEASRSMMQWFVCSTFDFDVMALRRVVLAMK